MAYNQRRWGSDGWTYHLRQQGRSVGANFANWKWWPNTSKAHQLVAFMEQQKNDIDSKDTTDQSNQALYEALYEEGHNISLVDTLVNIVGIQKLGLSQEKANKLRTFLEQDVAANQIQKEININRKKYNIRGVPFFIIGTTSTTGSSTPYAFSGAQNPETFIEIFNELASSGEE